MSPLLIALLGVLLVPLFVATWRTSLLGLAGQGLLMALIASALTHGERDAGDWITLFDLVVVRGLAVPIALYVVLRRQRAEARNDVIPPSLGSWAIAMAMVLVAFNVAEKLVPAAGEQRTLVAVATAAFLLGFLVLSTQAGPLSQVIGALRIENALALLELGGEHHATSLGVQLGLFAVYVATVALFRWYLAALGPAGPAAASAPPALTGGEAVPTPEPPAL